MRRKDREINGSKEIESIIKECCTLRIAMVEDQKPHIIPVNFGYTLKDGEFTFYIHSALKGHKVSIWEKNPEIAFELDVEIGLNPGPRGCDYGFFYQSVIGHGMIEKISGLDSKRIALNEIMFHQTGKTFTFTEDNLKSIHLYQIKVQDIIGKQCLPK